MSNQICMCCEGPAEVTQDNEGYSSCCNDRIGYADELKPQVAQSYPSEQQYADSLNSRHAARSWKLLK